MATLAALNPKIRPLADVPMMEAEAPPAATPTTTTQAPAPPPIPAPTPTKPIPTAPAPVPAPTAPAAAPLAPQTPVPPPVIPPPPIAPTAPAAPETTRLAPLPIGASPLAGSGMTAFGTLTPTTTEMVNGPGNTGPIGGPPPVEEQNAPAAPPSASAAPASFGAQDNLIGREIGPETDPRVARLQDAMVAGAEGLGTTPYDQYVRSQAEALQSGPDRRQIALDTLKLFDEQTADERNRATTQIGRDAARLGRLGSGMVTTDLGNLEERLQTGRNRFMSGLLSDVAGQEQSDRLARLGAFQDLQEGEFGRGQSRVGTLADVQNLLYGQGEAGRDELRGERAYQRQLSNEARDANIMELELANRLQNDEYARMAPLWQTLGGVGWDGTDFDPTQIERARLLAEASRAGLGTTGQTGYATGGY